MASLIYRTAQKRKSKKK